MTISPNPTEIPVTRHEVKGAQRETQKKIGDVEVALPVRDRSKNPWPP